MSTVSVYGVVWEVSLVLFRVPANTFEYQVDDRWYVQRGEGGGGPSSDEVVKVNQIRGCGVFDSIPNVMCRLQDDAVQMRVKFTNGASINNVVVGAAVTRHNDNGQFCKLDMAHGWARPICCCHGFGNDTRSVGHVGRLCPARGDWLKILVCMFSPNLEQRVHGERRGRSRSLIVGHKTPSKSWQGRLRCQGQLVRWRVFVIGRVRRDQGSGHGHGACCRVLGVAAWVLWHCRRFLHDVVGGDDGFRGQKK